jgi:hypothetical protein
MNKMLQRRLSAWALLMVFVPMLLLSSLHHHHQVPMDTETACYACLHHIHHDGHVSNTANQVDNCVLCHFHSLPYLSGASVVFQSYISVVHHTTAFLPSVCTAVFCGIRSTRAPPSILL